MEDVAALVIGAGVVGIAVARALAGAGVEVLVVDRARQVGSETSSRNSEVIHAGIYYPRGSLKARLCVAGRRQLYRYCGERGVPHRRCGKLIVATDKEQHGALAAIEAAAQANGVADIKRLDGPEVRALEPEVAGTAALFSPSTGILDSHALMLAMIGDAEAMGCGFVLGTAVDRIEHVGKGFDVWIEGEAAPVLRAGMLVNAAGLGAPRLAERLGGLDPRHVPTPYLAKGSYFALAGRSPFSHLVYPVPVPGGLGIHATIDLGGRVRFGPDVEWCDALDYAVDPGRAEHFYRSIRAYWPALPDDALVPDYSGIRPKLSGEGMAAADFRIEGPQTHGVPGLVNLFGIESPGLTASMAIGEHVRALLGLLGTGP